MKKETKPFLTEKQHASVMSYLINDHTKEGRKKLKHLMLYAFCKKHGIPLELGRKLYN